MARSAGIEGAQSHKGTPPRELSRVPISTQELGLWRALTLVANSSCGSGLSHEPRELGLSRLPALSACQPLAYAQEVEGRRGEHVP